MNKKVKKMLFFSNSALDKLSGGSIIVNKESLWKWKLSRGMRKPAITHHNRPERRDSKMGCEFLIGRQIKMCGAFSGSLVLSLEELNLQCQTNHYHACTLYQKYLKKGVKLPLYEYNKNYVLPSV